MTLWTGGRACGQPVAAAHDETAVRGRDHRVIVSVHPSVTNAQSDARDRSDPDDREQR